MKIAYLSNSIVPSKIANSIQVMKMCEAFAMNGNDVELYAKKSKFKCEDVYDFYGIKDKFKIIWQSQPKLRGIGLLIYAYKVYKHILKGELPDLFYGRSLHTLFFASRQKIPMIYEAHSLPKNILEQYLLKKITSNVSFKKLVVTSDALKMAYKKLCPWFDDNMIQVVRNGADEPKLNLQMTDNNPAPGYRYKVGYVGHLYPGKGMELIRQLAGLLPQVEFHIVGGRLGQVAYWKRIIDLENIIFHGYIQNNQLHNFYSSFDILIAPYKNQKIHKEGIGTVDKWASPLKIIEYMSYRKPIVASDLPMVREIIKDGQTGLLCKTDDIQSWVKSIQLLTQNEDLRLRISQNAYDQFIKNYTWDKRAKKIIEFICS
jgi:glycosyltransferase involved in cell wall biosynthesis